MGIIRWTCWRSSSPSLIASSHASLKTIISHHASSNFMLHQYFFYPIRSHECLSPQLALANFITCKVFLLTSSHFSSFHLKYLIIPDHRSSCLTTGTSHSGFSRYRRVVFGSAFFPFLWLVADFHFCCLGSMLKLEKQKLDIPWECRNKCEIPHVKWKRRLAKRKTCKRCLIGCFNSLSFPDRLELMCAALLLCPKGKFWFFLPTPLRYTG